MSAPEQLSRSADWFVEDILALSDEEVIAEAEEDGLDLERLRADMIAVVDRIEAGKPA